MILILEGPDGAGKSTLAANIAADWSTRRGNATYYTHNGPPETDNPVCEYASQLGAACRLHMENENAIIDRFSIGELVYPRTRGRYSPFSRLENDLLVQMSSSPHFNAQWVILAPPTATLIARLEAKGEVADIDRLVEERRLFVECGKDLCTRYENVTIFYTSNFTVEELVEAVNGLYQ